MGFDVRCPRCGSGLVHSTGKNTGEVILIIIFFKIVLRFYLIKCLIGVLVFVFLDWWLATINALKDKSYSFKCKYFFRFSKKRYYCQSCGNNFKV